MAHDPKPPHHLSDVVEAVLGACMAATGTGSLVFIDNVTADGSNRMNHKVYRALLSAQIQVNTAKLMGQNVTVQMDNEP